MTPPPDLTLATHFPSYHDIEKRRCEEVRRRLDLTRLVHVQNEVHEPPNLFDEFPSVLPQTSATQHMVRCFHANE